jgi:hypothetical protein
MKEWEIDLNYTTLENNQQVRENPETELNNSLSIYTKLHKELFIVAFKIHLPRIEELNQLKPDEQVF